jgi:hypothetical protein
VAVLVANLLILQRIETVAEQLRGEGESRQRRDADEIRRLKMVSDARDREVVNEATLLSRQEQNLRLAEQLTKKLYGEK